MPVKIVANRDSPKIDLPGVNVGPFVAGKEYEVRFWVAEELKKAGIAHIRMEEPIELMTLNKIHWKENVQSSQRVTALPENFYPKLRNYLEELSERSLKKSELRGDYEKAQKLSNDIARTRLKKIVSLASSPRSRQILDKLTKEELALYNYLYKKISEWKTEILKKQEEPKP
jgi:hypothetical protein